MKAKHVILSSILFSAVAMPMLASASGSSTGGSSVSATSSTSATKLLGRPGAASQATFVVDTTMKKPHLNIKCGETVVFTNGKDQFAWKFDVYGHRMVNLAQIAPAGFTDSEMRIYVARNNQERS